MPPLLHLYLWMTLAMLLVAGLLHLPARMGEAGRRLGEALCRAPLVDAVLFFFTALPWVAGAVLGGWAGFGAGIGAQFTALWIWILLHELAHPRARKGPRIYRTQDATVGRFRNHAGLWWTLWAVPAFWIVRFLQWYGYPVLVWTTRLPKIRHADFVNLSRHKFAGLIGYDLAWCLYCDWMTGVWSLGGEMLRNVESFWCPIRFYSVMKCEKCAVDFPDIEGGWVDADATMDEVVALLREKYRKGGTAHSWFGHPMRAQQKEEET
jgi:hypothetical protein